MRFHNYRETSPHPGPLPLGRGEGEYPQRGLILMRTLAVGALSALFPLTLPSPLGRGRARRRSRFQSALEKYALTFDPSLRGTGRGENASLAQGKFMVPMDSQGRKETIYER